MQRQAMTPCDPRLCVFSEGLVGPKSPACSSPLCAFLCARVGLARSNSPAMRGVARSPSRCYFRPMSNLTKREIVLEIFRKSGFPQKQIVDSVQQILDLVQRGLADGRNVELRNF